MPGPRLEFEDELRKFGVTAQAEISGRVAATGDGTETGALRRELTNPTNVHVGPTFASVRLPEPEATKFAVFDSGRAGQAGKNVGGVSDEAVRAAVAAVAEKARAQVQAFMDGADRG